MGTSARPAGVLGRAYMAALKPFRYRVVYPATMRHIEGAWLSRSRPVSTSSAA